MMDVSLLFQLVIHSPSCLLCSLAHQQVPCLHHIPNQGLLSVPTTLAIPPTVMRLMGMDTKSTILFLANSHSCHICLTLHLIHNLYFTSTNKPVSSHNGRVKMDVSQLVIHSPSRMLRSLAHQQVPCLHKIPN
jgi:protein-disulfide isomerase